MKYFTPLFPPLEIFHSNRSSKSVKSRSVMMSPPPPLATWVSQPSFTIHPCSGKAGLPNPRQPAVDLPSKRSIHGPVEAVDLATSAPWDAEPRDRHNNRVASEREFMGQTLNRGRGMKQSRKDP